MLVILNCCSTADISTINHTLGNENMSDKVLIAYGSHAGSTAEVADAIANTISKNGTVVDVKPASVVKSMDNYRMVILGSNVRAGQLAGDVKKFIKQFKAELQKMPVAVFVVCMAMEDDTPEKRIIADGYLNQFRKELKPVRTGAFAGKMEYAKLSFFPRLVIKRIVKVKEGDKMDWDAIRAWAEELSAFLDNTETPRTENRE